VVEDNIVAFNTESCTLFVVDGTNGHPLWSRWLGDPLMSQPAIADGRLYMAFPAGGGHRLIAFELRTGRELWRVPIQGDAISAPIAYGDSVFATTFDGTVYRFRATDGGLAWREAYHATSAPWLWGDQVFVSHREDGHQAMLSPVARALFGQANPTNEPPPPVESVGRMSGATGASTQSNGGWHAQPAPWLDPNVQNRSHYHHSQHESDTSVGFAAPPPTAAAPAALANVGQGTVRGMWEFQGSRPCVVDGRVFLTQGDHLVALDAESGHEIWSIPLHGMVSTEGGHLASPPAPAGGNLYIAGVAGEIVVVSQQDGRVLQTIHIGEPMRFQPSISGGRLYVGTTQGSVISLDLNDARADGWSMWGGTAAHNGR
jgi:Ca-activated chloride channel family protein